jgi:hypothetical protein
MNVFLRCAGVTLEEIRRKRVAQVQTRHRKDTIIVSLRQCGLAHLFLTYAALPKAYDN